STGNTATAPLRYTAYGEPSTPQGLQPLSYSQFAGEWGYRTEWSASYEPGTGLQYLQQRYYDPAVGRFISADPLSFDGGLNLYDYVGNDPVNGADPSGLQGLDEEEIPANGQGYFRQGRGILFARPEFRPGSKERTEYSRFLDTI